MRIEMADDFTVHVRDGERALFTDRLGPEILGDQQRYIPVDTGRALKSLDFEVADNDDGDVELRVGSYPDAEGDLDYILAVEFGFHGPETVRAHLREGRPVREHIRQGNSPEQPFLRPSLYVERGE